MDDVLVEAEQAVLAALLAEPRETWEQIADVCRAEHFGVEAHAIVARLAIAGLTEGKPVDPVLLIPEAQRQNVDPALVLGLARASGTTANARHYAERVRDFWLRRQVKAAARDALNDGATPGAELADRLAGRIATLETARGRGSRRLSDLIRDRGDLFEAQQTAKNRGEVVPRSRISTGFLRLDRLTGGVGVGQATVIGARPGTGKTALESALADNFAAHGSGVCVFQLEDYGQSLADRAIARRSLINTVQLRDASTWNADVWGRFDKARQQHDHLPIWIDDEHGLTPLDVAGKMRRERREHGVSVFMLDVLAELDVERWAGTSTRFSDDRLDRLLGKALRFLRDTAYSLDAALIVFLHLNREIERRSDPTPRLSDIKNSGDIEDAAHQIWFLSRPANSPGSFVIDVAKHRDGPIGRVTLGWAEDYSAVVNPKDSY